jgi:hypothetical protein
LRTQALKGGLQLALYQQQSEHLFSIRKWWYKPVAVVGSQLYSIADGEAVEFVIGKRMLCAQVAAGKLLPYSCCHRVAAGECCPIPNSSVSSNPNLHPDRAAGPASEEGRVLGV